MSLSHFGNLEGESPISPVFKTPNITLVGVSGCPGLKLGGCPAPGGPVTVPSPIRFAGFGDALDESVTRYGKIVKFVDGTPSRGHACRITKLENEMFDELDREYVTESDVKEEVKEEDVSKDDADDTKSWLNGNTGCPCDHCFKSCSWPELPHGRCTVQKAADIAKNEPDDVELKSVHPYSVSILSSVAQFRDKYERNVLFMDDATAILFEDFVEINHKLANHADTTSEWICLTGIFMLTNPRFALAYRTIYGSICCAHIMQHMVVHSENEYLVELLRRMLFSNESCPVRLLEKFQTEQELLYKNLIKF